jgi:crotonobetainyl-CoA hydratase
MTEPNAIGTNPVVVMLEHHILRATINRPDSMNAVNGAVSTGLGTALERAEADPDVRAVVITGAGDRAFCAGADLKAVGRGEDVSAAGHPEWGFAGVARHFISKPVIAAVNGFALGGGTELAFACDMVVAIRSAQFGLPEVKRGVYPGGGGALRARRELPPKIAMEMLLTGDPITADDAAARGLINRVVESDPLSAAVALAERVARNSPTAVQATKRLAYEVTEGPGLPNEERGWELNRREGERLMRSRDFREGLAAFAEKRAPVWEGR